MTLFDIDPNSVTAGWIPLALTVVLGVAVFLLFRSMRTQLRRIQVPPGERGAPSGDGGADAPHTADEEPARGSRPAR